LFFTCLCHGMRSFLFCFFVGFPFFLISVSQRFLLFVFCFVCIALRLYVLVLCHFLNVCYFCYLMLLRVIVLRELFSFLTHAFIFLSVWFSLCVVYCFSLFSIFSDFVLRVFFFLVCSVFSFGGAVFFLCS
jgi:hypothetical protein